jgi:branched-chain amino acid transport system ATP-binding protein
MPTSDALLELTDLSVRYGHVEAVRNVSLRVEPSAIVALLGANGAGKSSLLQAISGVVRSSSAGITLSGRRIDGTSPHLICRAGISHVFEGRRVVGPMTVRDNLELAARASKRCKRGEVAELLGEVFEIFPKLKDRQGQISGLMSGGEQQMLAIGRAIMAKPDLLLLDEPSMGLAPIVIEEIYELLRQRTGNLATVGILLAEQSASLALSVASQAYILSCGDLVFDGPVSDLNEEQMIVAYMGAAEAPDR